MLIIGCDFHSRFQQIAMLDSTGEIIERRLEHENGEAKMFYATLSSPARVGMDMLPTIRSEQSLTFQEQQS